MLLGIGDPRPTRVGKVHILKEALDLCDPEVRQALAEPLRVVREIFGGKAQETCLRDIDGEPPDAGLVPWFDTFCTLQWAEIRSSLGTWVEAVQPAFGPRMKNNFELTRSLDRRKIGPASRRREDYYRRLDAFFGPDDLLCMPTTPALAPVKGTLGDEARGYQSQVSYYSRTLSLTSIAGIGRLPQVTLPLGTVGDVPLGLSLLAGYGRDAFLLGVATQVAGGAQ